VRLAISAVLTLPFITLYACSGQDDLEEATATVRDSAGVAIVENAATAATATWSTAADASLRVGGDESDPQTQLYLAYSATLLSNGRLAVGNSGTSQVLVFDSAGRRIAGLGRRGSGPGEFSPIMRVLPSSRPGIVAEDLSVQRKLLRFDLDGVIEKETVLPLRAAPQIGMMWDPLTSHEGTAFILSEAQNQNANWPDVRRGPAYLIRYTYDGDGPDTVVTYPGHERFFADVGPRPMPGDGAIPGPRPLEPHFAATSRISGGGDPWRMAAGDQAVAAYDVYNEDGTLLRRVRWGATGRAPTARDLDLVRKAYVDASPRDPAGARRALAAIPAVSSTPVFDEIRVSQTNDIWVRRFPLPTDEHAIWWVFAEDGRLKASIGLPRGFNLLDITADQIVARVTDDLGIERIEVWPIRPEALPIR
jgi:hypothetical protein